MSEHNIVSQNGPPAQGGTPVQDLRERGLRPPPGLGFWRRLWWWFHFVILVKLARLRFIAVVAAVGAIIANWDTLKNYHAKWTRPGPARATAAAGIEFWCPMHPTVVRDHPDKCPACNMPLSKRKKGDRSEEEPLPAGVVSRVQLTPYRVALAGIETTEVGYRELHKEIRAVGFVEFDERRLERVTARLTGRNRLDRLHVNYTGQPVRKGQPLALVYSPDLAVTVQNLLDARQAGNRRLERLARDRLRLWGIDGQEVNEVLRSGKPITHVTIRSPITGHVIKKYRLEGDYVEEGTPLYDIADLSTVWIEAQAYEEDIPYLKEKREVVATTAAFPGRQFEGTVSFIHPHLDAATRTLRFRADFKNPGHALRPGMYATVTLRVPASRLAQFHRATEEDLAYRTAGDVMAHALFAPARPAAPGLEALLRAAVERITRDSGLALAVPERAVIDTGRRQLVYREAEPGVYEGVLVELGPRSGEFYPVVRGLEAGDRVATAGSFLIDAETRLTGGLASTYFGASGAAHEDHRSAAAARPSMVEDEEARIKAVLSKLSRLDRRLVEAQRYCPVRRHSPLGSMGRPIKLYLEGQPVFLCCKGCEKQARKSPARTRETVEQLKAGPPARGRPPAVSEEALLEADIRKALAELSSADRRRAEEQRFCAVMGENRLGSMGVPVKVLLKGKPVFLCCDSCEEKARARPARTLQTVERLRARHGRHGH